MLVRFIRMSLLALVCLHFPMQIKADTLAVGGSLAWSIRQEYASRQHQRFQPEFVAFGYIPVFGDFSGRVGIRGFYSWQDPDMPASLRFEEKDGGVQVDAGLLYKWYLVPSFTAGCGRIWRKTAVRMSAPLQGSASGISGTTEFSYFSAQVGMGLPVTATVLVEPFYRYVSASDDWRIKSVIGIEATISLF
jgi:hypothetical protein